MKKPTVLFERHCHATEKSEAIACARSSRSSWLNKVVDLKRIIGKKWRAEEEERHKGSLTQKKKKKKKKKKIKKKKKKKIYKIW
jgi:hypothetical protein